MTASDKEILKKALFIIERELVKDAKVTVSKTKDDYKAEYRVKMDKKKRA